MSATLLLPATKHDPSDASVTDRIGTSPAGVWYVFKLVEITWEANEKTHQFMRANVFGQIPLLDSAGLVARYQFPLVGVNTNIIDCVNG